MTYGEGGSASENAQRRVLALLSKDNSFEGLVPGDALVKITSPGEINLQRGVINHLKAKLVENNAEAEAGRDPEEMLGTGARKQIRFQPVVTFQPSKKTTISGRQRKQLQAYLNNNMNEGVKNKVGTVTVKGEGKKHPIKEAMGQLNRRTSKRMGARRVDIRDFKPDSVHLGVRKTPFIKAKKHARSKKRPKDAF